MSALPIYPDEVRLRAVEHHAHGWKPGEISRLLGREFGHAPAWATVKGWVDPAYREARRRACRTKQRRMLAERGGKPERRVSRERATARMFQLHGEGLSHLAISKVALVWWGEDISADGVRFRLKVESARRSYRPSRVEALVVPTKDTTCRANQIEGAK